MNSEFYACNTFIKTNWFTLNDWGKQINSILNVAKKFRVGNLHLVISLVNKIEHKHPCSKPSKYSYWAYLENFTSI